MISTRLRQAEMHPSAAAYRAGHGKERPIGTRWPLCLPRQRPSAVGRATGSSLILSIRKARPGDRRGLTMRSNVPAGTACRGERAKVATRNQLLEADGAGRESVVLRLVRSRSAMD